MITPERDWILYIDEDVLAVNKPAGLPALPDGYDPAAPHVKSLLEPQFGRLWNVHRLDRDTSGVMLFARSAQAHRFLNDQFQSRLVNKVYHALITGDPAWDEQIIDLPLRSNGDRRHRTIVDAGGGKPAVTRLRLLERFGDFSLVEAIPETGRTHQLRAHLRAAGFAIACDALYGGGRRLVASPILPGSAEDGVVRTGLLERMGLHASSLACQHPTSLSRMTFDAPYPSDFGHTLEILRQNPPSTLQLIFEQR